MQKTTFYKRFVGLFVISLCLLHSVNSACASQDLSDIRKLAEQGDSNAQYHLGLKYAYGPNAEDYQQAAFWYRKAAEQGDVTAQLSLGYFYDTGKGVGMDAKQAVVWYRKAAEQGDAIGQQALGEMYLAGKGVPQDNIQAYAWLSVAVANGKSSSESIDLRDLAAKKLTKQKLEAAQKLAGEYFEKYK